MEEGKVIKVENNKSRFITPGIMLFAGALAMIIMLIKQYDFYKMLWTLLVVLIVFYFIGDIARYLYSTIRPRVIPATLDLDSIAQQAEKRLIEDEEIEYLDDDFDDTAINQRKKERKAKKAMEQYTASADAESFSTKDFSAEENTEETQEADIKDASSLEDNTEEYGYSDEDLE